MEFSDIAQYTALALCAGFLIGAAWGGATGFVRALLNS